MILFCFQNFKSLSGSSLHKIKNLLISIKFRNDFQPKCVNIKLVFTIFCTNSWLSFKIVNEKKNKVQQ